MLAADTQTHRDTQTNTLITIPSSVTGVVVTGLSAAMYRANALPSATRDFCLDAEKLEADTRRGGH